MLLYAFIPLSRPYYYIRECILALYTRFSMLREFCTLVSFIIIFPIYYSSPRSLQQVSMQVHLGLMRVKKVDRKKWMTHQPPSQAVISSLQTGWWKLVLTKRVIKLTSRLDYIILLGNRTISVLVSVTRLSHTYIKYPVKSTTQNQTVCI